MKSRPNRNLEQPKLNFEPDSPHQCKPIAHRCNTVSHLVVEGHASVFKLFLKMNVSHVTIQSGADIGQCQVVGGD